MLETLSRNVTMDILYLYILVTMALVKTSVKAGKCTYTRHRNLLTADCFGQDFEEVPKNLRKDIEVLYATKNRIRSLTNSSLRDYTSLQLIYLGDNFITRIEPGAFSELNDLEVLDLTRNGFHSLPADLPAPLRTLYLANNVELQNISLATAYNLVILSLANCDLKEIPALGILPRLKELNVSGNPLTSVKPADLAPLCHLEKIFLPQSLYKGGGTRNQCECHRLRTWATHHYILLVGFNCTALDDPDAAGCNVDFSEELKVYKTCIDFTPPSSTRNLLIAVLAGCLLLAAIVIVCWWRKGRRKKNSVQDQKRQEHHKNMKAADTLIT